MTILQVRHLNIAFGDHTVIRDASFEVRQGETVALLGSSGSGKSVTGLALIGLLKGARTSGEILFKGQPLPLADDKAMSRLRGRHISFVFQEPMTALNPLHTIGRQIAEVQRIHFGTSDKKQVCELLSLVGLRRAGERLNAYPHELSGGERQRVVLAIALAAHPDLLIADEPTTALDVTLQQQILALLKRLQKKLNLTIILISHNPAVVYSLAQRCYKIEGGKIMPTALTKPTPLSCQRKVTQAPSLMQVKDLSVSYGPFKALSPICFDVPQGKTLAIVGESGSGKTSLGYALTRLVPSTGQVFWNKTDVMALSVKEFNKLRSEIQIVFQDPFLSLNPRFSVEQIICEGLKIHRHLQGVPLMKVIQQVGLSADLLARYPHELSGGQRQRVALARALILRPKLLVLDEPTSALDAQNCQIVLDLLKKLQDELHLSYVLISHDMSVVAQMADKLIVLKDGRVVEQGEAFHIFAHPKQPYTKKLLQAAFFT